MYITGFIKEAGLIILSPPLLYCHRHDLLYEIFHARIFLCNYSLYKGSDATVKIRHADSSVQSAYNILKLLCLTSHPWFRVDLLVLYIVQKVFLHIHFVDLEYIWIMDSRSAMYLLSGLGLGLCIGVFIRGRGVKSSQSRTTRCDTVPFLYSHNSYIDICTNYPISFVELNQLLVFE